jgi:TRAP-type C4-dicarboxylate transport system substrate-binding protein
MERKLVWSAVLSLCLLASQVGAVQLKVATLAPDGSSWVEAIREGAAEISERTEGRVTFRFYPGGTMGKESAVLRKIRIGQLHGGVFTAGTLAEVYPDFQIYTLPVAFSNYDEVDHVRTRLDQMLNSSLEQHGFVSFGIIEGGFAYIMSTKPITDFDSLSGNKAWIPEDDEIGKAILDAAGMAPIPLPLADVLTGLQTGLIDAVAGPPVGAVALQWFTKVKYLTDTPLLYTYGAMALSQKAFQRLSAGDQEVVRDVLGKVTAKLDRETRKDNERAREALVKQGIEIVHMSAEGEKRWSDVAVQARDRLADKGIFSRQMLTELETHLEQARAELAAAGE